MRSPSTARPWRLEREELVGYDGYGRRKGSKIHAAVTAESLPLSVAVGPGDEHDSVRLVEVMDKIRVKHGVGRPRRRPKELYADSAYDSARIRAYLRRRGIKATYRARIEVTCVLATRGFCNEFRDI
jgi:transposase